MRILVTGSSGQLGVAIAEYLSTAQELIGSTLRLVSGHGM